MNLKDHKTKVKVVTLAANGFSHRQIAAATELPRTTVQDFLNKRTFKDWWDKHEGLLTGEELADEDVAPKIAFIDIETSPILAYVWGLFNQNISIDKIHTDWEILCACFNWIKDDEVHTITNRDFWIGGKKDREILEEGALKLWALLDNADIIVAHNCRKFDNKKIRAKLLEHKLPPPRPYKTIDTLDITKTQFAMTSNKLDYITKYTGGGGKLKTDMQLWLDCLDGKETSWDYLEEYCAVDILELKRVYLEVRAWDNKHPNLQMYYDDNKKRCGTCGSTDVRIVDGQATTNFSVFDLYRCTDCGAYHRGRHNHRTQTQRSNTLMNIS